MSDQAMHDVAETQDSASGLTPLPNAAEDGDQDAVQALLDAKSSLHDN